MTVALYLFAGLIIPFGAFLMLAGGYGSAFDERGAGRVMILGLACIAAGMVAFKLA